jgi:hypothetical protein
MKKNAFILVLMFTMAAQAVLAGASINFENKTHDFGTLNEEDGSATYAFTFTNTGNSPLIIYKAVASCGCTTPVFSKEPIVSGASSTIKVTYNTSGRPGAFHKTITIYTNDTDAPNVVLIIKGTVTPKAENPESAFPKNIKGLRLKRTSVPMLEAKIGSIRTESIEMINTNPTPVSIGFNKVPKHVQVSVTNSLLQPNQTGVITLKYIAAAAKDFGKREDSFYVFTNQKDKTNPNNKILITANITEDFSKLSAQQMQDAPSCAFSENRINFGKMTRGTTKVQSVTLSNKGKTNLVIRKIVPEYDGIKVTPATRIIVPGKTIQVNITFNAGTFDGNVVQRITVITNDPKASINRLFVIAQVSGN